ncbi:MAG: hypothetical protein JO246_04250 [Frankiaceae bacterium]|nr:hypothetical protein [Frankiaceae bacterium]MBV9872552.1 hypothetical protein [Frankiaceae bacterium]
MRRTCLIVAATVALPAAALAAPAASARLAASHGVKNLHRVTVRLSKGHVCGKAVINGMTENGTVIGTTFCGRSAAFVRKPSGATTVYRLPKKYGRYTYASNISSNGIMAVVGQHKTGGKSTSYLVARNGDITALVDPAAAGHDTVVNGVNRYGAAVGIYCLNHKCSKSASFIYRRGSFTTFTLKRKQLLPNLSEITDRGALIGSFYQYPNGNLRGFVRAHGKTKVIDAPGASQKLGYGTFLLGGANHGTVCGASSGPHRYEVGFVRRHGHNHVINLKPHVHHAFSAIEACNDSGEVAIHARLKSGPAVFLGKLG